MSDRYAIIDNEFIVNVIISDESFIKNNYPDAVLCPEPISVGDKYVDGEFILNRFVVSEDVDGETL